jgi:hypothetical protein
MPLYANQVQELLVRTAIMEVLHHNVIMVLSHDNNVAQVQVNPLHHYGKQNGNEILAFIQRIVVLWFNISIILNT